MILNLINPAASEVRYESFVFPDGQPHIKIDTSPLKNTKEVTIISRLSNMNEVFLCLAAKNVLDDTDVEKVALKITYLLAARMDRVMTNGEPFSLKIIAQMLNAAHFHKITIFDPHSDVATALIQRSVAISNELLVRKVLQHLNLNQDYYLVSPDAGALKKVYKIAEAVQAPHVAECIKFRDIKTGKLSGFKTFEEDFKGLPCIIVDDICDGGGTFAGLAEVLKKRNAGTVILVVSHGIFSKGFNIPNVDFIFSTDSFRAFENIPPHIRLFPINSLI